MRCGCGHIKIIHDGMGFCHGYMETFRVPCECTEYDEQTAKHRNIITVELPKETPL